MKKYYINLTRSIDRKIKMEQMYSDLIRIEAYDGIFIGMANDRKHSISKYNDIIIPQNTNASASELGCTFSHIKAIITAYLNGDDGVLIMEDDIYDVYKSKWKKNIDDIIKNAPKNYDCIILHCINASEIKAMIDMKNDYSPWNESRWSTGAYYINKNGIDKIYNMYYKNGKIQLNNTDHKADGQVIYGLLKTCNYTKPLFIHTIKNSYIHNDHIQTIHIPAYIAIVNYFHKIK